MAKRGKYLLVLDGLSSKQGLFVPRVARTFKSQILEQVKAQHWWPTKAEPSANRLRYSVCLEIIEGRARPAKDVDNYAKKTIDGITRTKLIWLDDEQMGSLTISRKRDPSRVDTQVTVRIEPVLGRHSGAPTFFRALCRDATKGASVTYADAAYHLTHALWSQIPYDLEVDEWAERIDDLTTLLDDNAEAREVWHWFREQLPECMKHVPRPRMEHFVSGVRRAYDEGCLDSC